MEPIFHLPIHSAHDSTPATVRLACHTDKSTAEAYRRSAKRIGVTMAQFVRNAVRAYADHLDKHFEVPQYDQRRNDKGEYATISARITQHEDRVIAVVQDHFGFSRSQVMLRALHHYHTTIAYHMVPGGARNTQKPRAPRKTGPVKSTVSIRLPPKHEKFLRAYAKVNEISLGETVVHALDLLRERELASAAAGSANT